MNMSKTENTPKSPLEILTSPLRADEIEWKVQASKNGKTLIAPYIDSRAVMSRFDAAFGPFGWQNALKEVGNGEGMAWLCGIGVKDESGEWIWKWDGSGLSDIEPVKGGISGAMKRAATQWGVGRELYNYPKVYLTGEHKFIPLDVLKRLEGLPTAIAKGVRLPEVITLNPNGSDVRKVA
ncbi:Rad52/22 double-strand break repair protein [Allomeiothermus silvanus DSM 9946]|uniref:Rad52/22 double-strand break repair protein n=1 Tax=Allomeiothermus silvanus (strain ATCC 700542 / DSM 9946 / NBRC 106475 / NCIMB 13440 / VI-R2) TaxID=526227 RepID=D7BEG5_ALLS1|nr:Rad52/22 double-strand break repair protein [Allomeiothermus silvanus DSM 9946]